MEYYLSHLNDNITYNLLKFRTANHKLPVETGRYTNTPYEERKCIFCPHQIGDEFHYIMECQHFVQERRKYIKPYYFNRPNMYKYKQLMTNKNINVLNKLSLFVKQIMKEF